MDWLLFVGKVLLWGIGWWIFMKLALQVGLLCVEGYKYRQMKQWWRDFDGKYPGFSDDPRWRDREYWERLEEG